MADTNEDLIIQRGDTIVVTFNDATTLDATFQRFFPAADGVSALVTVPAGTLDPLLITSTYYIDSFRHIQKLTPTTP